MSDDRAKIHVVIMGLHAQLTHLYEIVGETPPQAAVRSIADVFCRMDDDQQALFFVEVATQMETWPNGAGDRQAWNIGRHLATCACSTMEARELVAGIAAAVIFEATVAP